MITKLLIIALVAFVVGMIFVVLFFYAAYRKDRDIINKYGSMEEYIRQSKQSQENKEK